MDADPTIVRLVWVLLVVFPIPILPAVLAYLIAWLVIPSALEQAPAPAGQKRLLRSRTDRAIAGVCGGMAAYLGIDATVVRVVWAILGVVPGAIIGGLIAYFIAWIIIPEEAVPGQAAAYSRGNA
jgi:phage shock protein C